MDRVCGQETVSHSYKKSTYRILLEALSPSGTRMILLALYVSWGLCFWFRATTGPHKSSVTRTATARLISADNESVSFAAQVDRLVN